MKVLCVAGTRPNFVKLASLTGAMGERDDFDVVVVHTGQHYDERMSTRIFTDLGLPRPDINLEVGSASHCVQLARIFEKFEPVLRKESPDLVIVVGDVNSTVACAVAASREKTAIAHVEAGLRSGDRDMPEEINRVLTDSISDFFFITEASARANLLAEGVPAERCFLVGNTMVDTLLRHIDKARALRTAEHMGLRRGEYGVVTLHRPSNVDKAESLSIIVSALVRVSERLPLVFPVHPRTKDRMVQFGLEEKLRELPGLFLTEALGYLEFLSLQAEAGLLLTDSGGIQEEAVILKVPCLTLRENTERPATIDSGVNRLVELKTDSIVDEAFDAFSTGVGEVDTPFGWDGGAGARIADILARKFHSIGRR